MVRAQQPYVGGDQVSGPQPDDISRYEVAGRHFSYPGSASRFRPPLHAHGGGDHVPEVGHGPFGPVFSVRAQDAADGDERDDHGGRAPGRDGGGDQAEGQQYARERVACGTRQSYGPPWGPGRGQCVRAVQTETNRRVVLGQSPR